MAVELVLHFRVIGQAQASGVGGLHQDAGVEAPGRIVALDLYIVVASPADRESNVRFQGAGNPVDGRAKTNRDFIVERVADSWLKSDDFDFALAAECAALEAVFVVGDQSERSVDTKTNSPFIVEFIGIEAHRYCSERNHIAFVGSA
ncbi:hypothetical protein D3C76_1235250 [compost metagenome]